jgi:Sperm-tail PG-rich repeat
MGSLLQKNAVQFGNSFKKSVFDENCKEAVNNPGPGAYNIESQFYSCEGSGFDLNNSKNEGHRANSPKDVTDHDFLLTVPKNPVLPPSSSNLRNNSSVFVHDSIQESVYHNNNHRASTVDPNDRRSFFNRRLPGTKFSKSQRYDFTAVSTVSPGPIYQTRMPLSNPHKLEITIKNRYKDFLKMFDKTKDLPGPGKYNISDKILNLNRGRTIYKTGRFRDN